ncbi:MAG: oligosaccharide flippase family protein [Candidatus Woesearchaeota archaeon]|jgi:O-antigen/teichoic acid export membrane protein
MNLKKVAIIGLIFTLGSVFYTQIINFILKIILTRILLPDDFGVMSLIFSITSIMNILFTLGWTEKLIAKKQDAKKAFYTIFTLLFIIGLFFTILIIFISPFLATYFNTPQLTNLLQLYSLTFILFPISIIYSTYLQKYLLFLKKTTCEIISSTVFFVVAIILAYLGYGIWSLVIAQVVQAAVFTLILFISVGRWFPTFTYDKMILKEFYCFVKESGTGNILGILILTVDNLFIGKYSGIADLGYYTLAFSLSTLFVSVISISIGNVVFPFLAMTVKKEEVKRYFMKAIQLNFIILFPMLFFCFLFAMPLITLLFSTTWIPAVALFKIFLIYTVFRSYCSLSTQLALSTNKPVITKRIFFIELIILAFLLYPLFLLFHLQGIAFAVLISRATSAFLFYYFTKTWISFSFIEHITIMYKPFLLSLFLSLIAYYISSFFTIISFFQVTGIFLGYITAYWILLSVLEPSARYEAHELIRLLFKMN